MKAATTMFAVALLVGLSLGIPQESSAEPLQSGMTGPSMADVEVHVIYAKKAQTKPKVDPKLKGLKRYFNRFPGYNWYQLVKVKTLSVPLGDTVGLQVPGKRLLKLKYRGVSKGFVKLRFELGDMHMNVRVHNGGVFFHSGFNFENGRIILAIRPRTKAGSGAKKIGPPGKHVIIKPGIKASPVTKPVIVKPRPKVKIHPPKK